MERTERSTKTKGSEISALPASTTTLPASTTTLPASTTTQPTSTTTPAASTTSSAISNEPGGPMSKSGEPVTAAAEGFVVDFVPASFSTSDAAAVFGESFLDEEKCRDWVLRKIHPGGPRCPDCGELLLLSDASAITRFWAGKRCVCKSCGRWFTALSGTFLQGMHLSFRGVFLMAVLADFKAEGVSGHRMGTTLNISTDTVRNWTRRFKAMNG